MVYMRFIVNTVARQIVFAVQTVICVNMSRQLWPNLSVGVCWPLCMSLLSVCVLSEWERGMGEWTRCTLAQFSWAVSNHESPLAVIYFGDTLIASALFSVPDLTWSPPVTSPYPHQPDTHHHWNPTMSLTFTLVPLFAHLSFLSMHTFLNLTLTILSRLLMVSVQHPSTSLPRIQPSVCLCPHLSSLPTFHLSYRSLVKGFGHVRWTQSCVPSLQSGISGLKTKKNP